MRNWYVDNVDNDYIWWSRWIFFLFTIMRMMRNWHFDNDHIYETMMMNWFYDTIGLIYYPFPLYKTQFERVYLLTRWEKGRGLSLSSSPITKHHILSCHHFIMPSFYHTTRTRYHHHHHFHQKSYFIMPFNVTPM